LLIRKKDGLGSLGVKLDPGRLQVRIRPAAALAAFGAAVLVTCKLTWKNQSPVWIVEGGENNGVEFANRIHEPRPDRPLQGLRLHPSVATLGFIFASGISALIRKVTGMDPPRAYSCGDKSAVRGSSVQAQARLATIIEYRNEQDSRTWTLNPERCRDWAALFHWAEGEAFGGL
jgi:hypothetical protein